MPSKKRVLEDSDANAQPSRAPKQQKKSKETERDGEEHGQADVTPATETNDNNPDKEPKNKKPEEYICINRPPWDRERTSEDDESDEGEDNSSPEQSSGRSMFRKPAAEHPEWKWVMMWKSFQVLCDYSVRARYTDPDSFGMYIYNDFHGYGLIELAENAVAEFHKEHGKKEKDRSLHLMWAPIAMLGYWLNNDNMMEMTMVDDGDRVYHLVHLMGHALLTALHAIDRAGKLTKDSEFRDLGLVMTLYLKWSYGWDEYNDEGDEDQEDGQALWRERSRIRQKAGVDLKTVGCALSDEQLDDVRDAEPLKECKKADRWNWKRIFQEYANEHGIRKGQIGGQKFDITKMSSKQRAAHAFDKVDPLKDIPADVLKENRLDFQ